MFKRFLAASLACAVWGTVSLTAYAASAERSSVQTGDNESEIEYIYSEIVEKSINTYNLYEEILANQIIFYSNVSNGNITESTVTLDLPETVDVTVEKDGKNIDYKAGESFSDPGKYALTLKVKGSDLLGGNENEVYYGIFSFWIVEASEDDNYADDYDDGNDYDYDDGYDSEIPDDNYEYDADDKDNDNTAESGDPGSSDSTSGGEAENTSETDKNDPDDEEQGVLLPATDKGRSLSQYVTSKNIRVVTNNGTEFFCNIPAGMTTTNNVQFQLPDNTMYKLMKDGAEQTDFNAAKAITARGEYTLVITDGDSANPSEFSFTIIGKYAKGITQYTVPDGCRIENAMYNQSGIRANGTSADLGAEGEYTFDVFCGDLYLVESFTLDNTPPEFTVNGLDEEGKSNGGSVFIEMISDDIDYYVVYLNKEPYKNTLQLTDPGKYTVIFYDKAGNATTQSFEIIYQMDGMAILAVVLGGALVVAGLVFFIITRKKFTIR